jgi:hypothetical protein
MSQAQLFLMLNLVGSKGQNLWQPFLRISYSVAVLVFPALKEAHTKDQGSFYTSFQVEGTKLNIFYPWVASKPGIAILVSSSFVSFINIELYW